MTTYWVPPYLKQFGDWLVNSSTFIFGRWEGHPENGAEGGMDVGSPGGTPVYAAASGFVQGVGNFWHSANLYTPGSGNPGYGVVTERSQDPITGAWEDLYYQHIAINPTLKTCYAGNCGGQYIHKGDLIGTIIPGVNMLEMGVNANWGGVWGANHPGPWLDDPRKVIADFIAGGPPATLGGQPTVNGGCTSSDPCLGCGAKGSPEYISCLAASVASQGTGAMPACASCGTTVTQDALNAVNPDINNFFYGLMHADWKLIGIGLVVGLISIAFVIGGGYLTFKELE